MITRKGFYAALENIRNMVKTFRRIEDALGVDLGNSLIDNMLEEGWSAFINIIFGELIDDEQIYEVFFNEPISFRLIDENGELTDKVGILPYDKYYEFFVEKRFENEWLVLA